MSLRQIAKQLGISPAYLSYMVNGKRTWRADLYERYSELVNTSINGQTQSVNKITTDVRGSLDTKAGAGDGIRTHDSLLGKQILYH